MSDTKVKVAVRVRPMNRRELELNTKCVVEMEGNQTVLHPPPANTKQGERKPPKVFAFDYCFWSMDESNTTKYAGKLALSLHLIFGPQSSSSVFFIRQFCFSP
uniref:kinesin-like protein KIF13A isoform X1 n=1 Tax=Halichoerus grypus TaxID=9711 RepID=UPI0016594D48|nr:kinesin-like protein KIF13A isoform X1 [Halichoerus grypus]